MIATISRIGFHVTVASSGLGEKKNKQKNEDLDSNMCVHVCLQGFFFPPFFVVFE